MFYPPTFSVRAGGLPTERILDVESRIMGLFIQADRAYLREVGRDGLIAGILDELRFAAEIEPEERSDVAALLQANAASLWRFVLEHVIPTPSYTHFEWLQPDWERVQELLGEDGVQRWRCDLADWERSMMEAHRENQAKAAAREAA